MKSPTRNKNPYSSQQDPKRSLSGINEESQVGSTTDNMKHQIIKTKIEYQNLLNSGKIKDQKKREAVQSMLQQLNEQLEGLDDILPAYD